MSEMVHDMPTDSGQMARPCLLQPIQARRCQHRDLAATIAFGANPFNESLAGQPLHYSSQPADGDRDEVRQLAHPQ